MGCIGAPAARLMEETFSFENPRGGIFCMNESPAVDMLQNHMTAHRNHQL